MCAQTPVISVIMPVYNTLRYLNESVESILAQSFREFEFLIFDDGSTDGSRERLQEYADRDARIQLFEREHGGLTRLLNEGIQKAKGPFISRMDSDDVAEKNRFEAQLNFLVQHPEHVAVGSEILRIDSGSLPIGIQRKFENHDDIIHAFLSGKGGAIIHPSAMFSREALEHIGGYRPEFEPAEDFDLFIRLSEVGKLANLSQPLMRYRLHFKRTTEQRRTEQLDKVKEILTQAWLQRGLGEIPADLLNTQKTLTPQESREYWAYTAISQGYSLTGLKYAVILMLAAPLSLKGWRLLSKALLSVMG